MGWNDEAGIRVLSDIVMVQKLLVLGKICLAFVLCWISSELLFAGILNWLIPGVPDDGPVPMYAFPYVSLTYHSGNLALFHDAAFTFCGIASWLLVALPGFLSAALRRTPIIPLLGIGATFSLAALVHLLSRSWDFLMVPEYGYVDAVAFGVSASLLLAGVVCGLFLGRSRKVTVPGFEVVR